MQITYSPTIAYYRRYFPQQERKIDCKSEINTFLKQWNLIYIFFLNNSVIRCVLSLETKTVEIAAWGHGMHRLVSPA
uniref:Uncharacterized protein n=1 Tax=Anguilla anguilla TaxID=7936 RepID=A0A0E9WSD0_ANGAN